MYPSRIGRLLPVSKQKAERMDVSKQKAERMDATDHHQELLPVRHAVWAVAWATLQEVS
jgi:hypothetical protein